MSEFQAIGWHGFELGLRIASNGEPAPQKSRGMVASCSVACPVSKRRRKAFRIWKQAFQMGLDYGGAPGTFVAIGSGDEDHELYETENMAGPLGPDQAELLEKAKETGIEWADHA